MKGSKTLLPSFLTWFRFSDINKQIFLSVHRETSEWLYVSSAFEGMTHGSLLVDLRLSRNLPGAQDLRWVWNSPILTTNNFQKMTHTLLYVLVLGLISIIKNRW